MNVTLVGYGFAGKTFHAPLIRSVPGLQLTTVVTSRVAAPTAEDVFTDSAIDLVIIATPNVTHFDLARRALAAGKHVVVDKPFTITVAEAEELIALAKETGRFLSVFHNRRWDGDFLTVRQLIAAGELGELSHFESHYDRYRPVVQDRWRERAGPGSGIWYDLGSHLVDQALQLFGPPDAVFADLAMQREGAVAIDYFHVVLRYGRMRAVLHGSSLVAETVRRFEVHGTLASFVKYGMDPQEDALKRGGLPDSQHGVLTHADGTVRQVPILPGNYASYYEAVRDAIEKGAPNPVPPEEALAVMRVLEAVPAC